MEGFFDEVENRLTISLLVVLRSLNKQVIPYVHPTRAGKEVKRMAAKVYKTGFHLKYDS